MARVGLVLGAGGVVGQAYHAGVLAALAHDLGWDPRTADVIVGSSAGSVTGSLLRLGVPAEDLARWAVEAPLSVETSLLLARIGGPPRDQRFPGFGPREWLRPWRPPSPALLARLARRPWAFRPSVVAATMLPRGWVDISDRTGALGDLAGPAWPDGLWVCAARCDDGGRVVFGRPGSPPATLGAAVAASCAIPGWFRTVRIGGVDHFDGGVHSPTSADVLRDEQLDVVVVVSPMSAAGGVARTADGALRWAAHRRLEREVRCLRDRGTAVVRIEPGRRALEAMGVNAMATDRSAAVVQAAFLDAGRYAATPAIADRLAPLAERAARRRADG
ncbi:MAG TPA: patatin-like phospholipase family protein [Acidimicrobiales bacterium]|jgi:NTE family protein